MKRSRILIAVPVSSSNKTKAQLLFHTNDENKLKKIVKLYKISKTHDVKSLTV